MKSYYTARYIRPVLYAVLTLVSVSFTCGQALAQPKARTGARAQQRAASPSSRLRARAARQRQQRATKAQSQTAGQGKVIEFKQLSVEGTVQRPSAAYFLQRRKLKFRGIEPKKSFIPEILTSVKRYPF